MFTRVFSTSFVVLSGIAVWIAVGTHSFWWFVGCEVIAFVLSLIFGGLGMLAEHMTGAHLREEDEKPSGREGRGMTYLKKATWILGVGLCITLGVSTEIGWPSSLLLGGIVNAVVSGFLVIGFDESERRWLAIFVCIVGLLALALAHFKGGTAVVYATLIAQSIIQTVMAAVIASHGAEITGQRAQMPT